MLILLSDAFDASLPDRLAPFGDVTDDKARRGDAHVVLIRSKTRVDRDYIDAAPNLELVIRGGVGLDNVDVDYATEKGITVHNTAAASSVAVAELTVAMLLAMPNHVVRGHNGMVEGQWLKKELKRTELFQKTLGIIGCGRIGREVAKRCAAFGMRVVAFDPMPIDDPTIQQLDTVDALFAEADYITINTPLVDSTRGMIDAAAIAKMQDGVFLANTGRGQVVVEADVAQALRDGKIAGFATDVWYSDPPEDSPLIGAPNTLLLPHLGASTKENLLRIGDIIVDLVSKHVKETR